MLPFRKLLLSAGQSAQHGIKWESQEAGNWIGDYMFVQVRYKIESKTVRMRSLEKDIIEA